MAESSKGSQPNILLVITHDSGRHFGCYGAGVDTPNIDRIGREGVLFEQAFCAAPQCSPARASLLTGLYPHRNGLIGLTHRGFRLDPKAPRLPALLADAGYHTLLFGLHHEEEDAHRMGYRRVVTQQDRTIRNVLPVVEDYLASQPAQPFFACVGFMETHRPYDAARYPMDDPDDVIVPPWLPDEPIVRADMAELNGVIRAADEAVGRLDSALAQAGLADNTLLIYTTDHGVAFPWAKGTLYDPGLEVALVARLACGLGCFAGGKVISQLVGAMDLTPTLLELAGAAVPPDLDGRSLLPLLAGAAPGGDRSPLNTAAQPSGQPSAQPSGLAAEPTEWRDCIFGEQTFHAAYDPVRSARTATHKYIRSFADRPMMFAPNVDPGPTKDFFLKQGLHRQPRPPEQLFDLRTDPIERKNLAADPACAPVLEDMRQRLKSWMEQTGDPLLAGEVAAPQGARVTPAGAMEPAEMDSPADWRK